jgi:hypothetical protein
VALAQRRTAQPRGPAVLSRGNFDGKVRMTQKHASISQRRDSSCPNRHNDADQFTATHDGDFAVRVAT